MEDRWHNLREAAQCLSGQHCCLTAGPEFDQTSVYSIIVQTSKLSRKLQEPPYIHRDSRMPANYIQYPGKGENEPEEITPLERERITYSDKL